MFVLIIVCFLIQPANAKKKGIVTIATLGPSPITVSANTEPQQVVSRVIAHWKQHFSRVLPDKPDLIVVPEACDRPRGLSQDKQKEYFDYAVATVNLDCALVHLDENWVRLRAMNAKYGPKVKMIDPGRLGAVLIASEHETVSIGEMIDEFEIERLDDYFARSLAHRLKPGNMEE